MRKTNLWCLLSLLALAAVPCAGNELQASVTLDVDLLDVYLPFSFCANSNFTDCTPVDVNPQGDAPAGTYPISGDLGDTMSGYISVFALDASNGDVVVGLNNGISAVGNPWPFSTPEATIASYIAGGTTADQAALGTFFANNYPYWLDPSLTNLSGGQLVEFSNGVAVGTFDATITPEPGSLGLAAFMLAGLFLARRLKVDRARRCSQGQ
jgi:hypothetical protein